MTRRRSNSVRCQFWIVHSRMMKKRLALLSIVVLSAWKVSIRFLERILKSIYSIHLCRPPVAPGSASKDKTVHIDLIKYCIFGVFFACLPCGIHSLTRFEKCDQQGLNKSLCKRSEGLRASLN